MLNQEEKKKFYIESLIEVTKYLKTLEPVDRASGEYVNAFEISQVMAIIFDKPKEEIIVDIASVGKKM